jgi:hypothetical protein
MTNRYRRILWACREACRTVTLYGNSAHRNLKKEDIWSY